MLLIISRITMAMTLAVTENNPRHIDAVGMMLHHSGV